IAACIRAGQDAFHISLKQSRLAAFYELQGLKRLSDLTADTLEKHLGALKGQGLGARTINHRRQIVVAFAGWLVKNSSLQANSLSIVPKQDEQRDRRRVRRPLTDVELARLLEVAKDHGRRPWYLAAALAGLRRGDLLRLRWIDIDFTDATITI